MLFNTMINVGAGRAAWDVSYIMPAAQGGRSASSAERPQGEKVKMRGLPASDQRARNDAARTDRKRHEYRLQAEDDGAVLLCRD